VIVGDNVGDPDPATGSQHARDLGQHRRFVGRQVDHAVGDRRVDRFRGEWDLLDHTLQEVDVVRSCLPCVSLGEGEHLVGHVDAVGRSCRTDTLRRQDHVDPTTRTEIEDRLTLVQLSDRGRISAAE
jgi:hypothetical protein